MPLSLSFPTISLVLKRNIDHVLFLWERVSIARDCFVILTFGMISHSLFCIDTAMTLFISGVNLAFWLVGHVWLFSKLWGKRLDSLWVVRELEIHLDLILLGLYWFLAMTNNISVGLSSLKFNIEINWTFLLALADSLWSSSSILLGNVLVLRIVLMTIILLSQLHLNAWERLQRLHAIIITFHISKLRNILEREVSVEWAWHHHVLAKFILVHYFNWVLSLRSIKSYMV